MMTPDATGASESEALAAVARLLGRLLVREIDSELLAKLRRPGLAAALAHIGIALPAGEPAVVLEALAAEYYGTFLDPAGGVSLVQSVAVEGRYEGEAAVAIRQLAHEAGLEHDAAPARGAPGDHLGSILLLWADICARWPVGARHLEDRHLAWAKGPLEAVAARGDFYAQVARATLAFAEPLRFRASWGSAGSDPGRFV